MSIGQKMLGDWDAVSARWQSLSEEQTPLKSHIFDGTDSSLSVLDQRLLPSRTEYVRIRTIQDAFEAIKHMKVRGAPLIATVGMYSLLVDLASENFGEYSTDLMFLRLVQRKCQLLLSARPTAINLANAIDELIAFLKESPVGGEATVDGLKIRMKQFVLNWQSREGAENEALLRNSVGAVLRAAAIDGQNGNGDSKKLVVMTICNTGQLATSSLGTALGVILVLHRLNLLQMAIALETRPYNQGSRLTAFELQQSGVPFRLIVDSAAASAMRHFGVDVVLVGADQVARNGDTANKIGTYALAVLARHHRIPFFVVTPMSSVNGRIACGDEIQIEERPPEELTQWNGVSTCPADCPVWNPAFDVTPAELITGILTEKGNFTPMQLAEQF
uniref:Methylthioribose-1-phosphate isomerase n=1 Tax=Globodera pallida TaxID=36090 RepID=A0A183BSZ6_GLOPA